MTHAVSCDFEATNNEVGYEALIFDLQIGQDLGIKKLQVPREGNIEANTLDNLASAIKIHPGIKITISHVLKLAIEHIKEDVTLVEDLTN